jgi:hypothetical protein
MGSQKLQLKLVILKRPGSKNSVREALHVSAMENSD